MGRSRRSLRRALPALVALAGGVIWIAAELAESPGERRAAGHANTDQDGPSRQAGPASPQRGPLGPEEPTTLPGRPSPGKTVIVAVMGVDGRLVADAEVSYRESERREVIKATTNEVGAAELHVARRGTFHARGIPGTRSDGYGASRGTQWSPLSNTGVVLLSLPGSLSISGVVLAKDGRTPIHARLHARLLAREEPIIGTGSADPLKGGRFSIEGLPPGTYRLEVEHSKTFFMLLPAAAKVGRDDGFDRGLPPARPPEAEAGTVGLLIVFEEGAWIRFHAIDTKTGEEVHAPGTVEVVTARGALPSYRTHVGSRIAVRTDPGVVSRVRVTLEGYRASDWLTVDPVAPGGTSEVVVKLQSDPSTLARLELHITDDGGASLRSVQIHSARRQGSTSFGRRHVLHSGRVEIVLSPGKSRIEIRSPSWPNPPYDQPWLPAKLEVSVARGERVTRAVVLQRGGWLRVHDSVGVGGPMSLAPENAEIAGFAPRVLRPRFRMAPEGKASIALLPPGRYELECPLLGGATARIDVVIRPGEITDVREAPNTEHR